MATQTIFPWHQDNPQPDAKTAPNDTRTATHDQDTARKQDSDPTAPNAPPHGFQCHKLNHTHRCWTGPLPDFLMADQASFAALWALHPEAHPTIHMHGKPVQIPRWQQAYGADYAFSGTVSQALDIPPQLLPYLDWCREVFHPDINGLLLNWYDGALGHYIGKHRDSTKNMVEGAPIITISLGEERIFRLRPWRDTPVDAAKGYVDLPVPDGTVCILPYETNLRWTHEVTRTKKAIGKRISITARAFHTDQRGR